MVDRYMIVGLGNPGRKYENTRHNVGFWVIDALAEAYPNTGFRSERKALITDTVIADKRVILAKPQTFMNLSGESVRALSDFYKIAPENIMVIHDHLDIPANEIRIRESGGHGGQNGVRNIIQHLGTDHFPRIRFGIGRPPGRMEARDYVLQAFSGDEAIQARELIDRSIRAIERWLSEGLQASMRDYNGKLSQEASKPTAKEEYAIALRAHELAPDDPKVFEKLIKISKQLGKVDEAANYHLELAALFDELGKIAKANDNLEQYVSMMPQETDICFALAERYIEQKNFRKAIWRYLDLAEYYQVTQSPDQARACVEKALALNPQHPKALAFKQRLDP